MRLLLLAVLVHCVIGGFYFDIPSTYPSVLSHTASDSSIEEATPSSSPTLDTDSTTTTPTIVATEKPTVVPTILATEKPTIIPTIEVTEKPTVVPTIIATEKPSAKPTAEPTDIPSPAPSEAPTNEINTEKPSAKPTAKPTDIPSPAPSEAPTNEINTEKPSAKPTIKPTKMTAEPTFQPSLEPTNPGGEYAYGDDNGENTAAEFTDILTALFSQLDEKSIAFLSGVVITLILIFVVVRRWRRPIVESDSYSRLPTTDIELVTASQGNDDNKWDDWDNDEVEKKIVDSASKQRGVLSLTKSTGLSGSNHSVSSAGSSTNSSVLNGKEFRITPIKQGGTPESSNTPRDSTAGITPKATLSSSNSSSNSIKSLNTSTKLPAISPKTTVDEDLFEAIGIAAKPKFLTPIPPPPVASTPYFSPFQQKTDVSNSKKPHSLADIEADGDGGAAWDDLDELVP